VRREKGEEKKAVRRQEAVKRHRQSYAQALRGKRAQQARDERRQRRHGESETGERRGRQEAKSQERQAAMIWHTERSAETVSSMAAQRQQREERRGRWIRFSSLLPACPNRPPCFRPRPSREEEVA